MKNIFKTYHVLELTENPVYISNSLGNPLNETVRTKYYTGTVIDTVTLEPLACYNRLITRIKK